MKIHIHKWVPGQMYLGVFLDGTHEVRVLPSEEVPFWRRMPIYFFEVPGGVGKYALKRALTAFYHPLRQSIIRLMQGVSSIRFFSSGVDMCWSLHWKPGVLRGDLVERLSQALKEME